MTEQNVLTPLPPDKFKNVGNGKEVVPVVDITENGTLTFPKFVPIPRADAEAYVARGLPA